ncbi:PepSY domain-containing protein [Clostridium sp. DMHC 10]|uniref:PepSY domain-containing protein n=1 Tax=Clostridium sp. DMHC 10 TaxID=747377 RepID=UPI00069DB52B|nr:PepSY domain-containing protein [Clostridium sp. DMHC 10]
MNKKIVSIALTGLLGVTLLSTGLVKNNVFASTIGNKTETEVSKEKSDDSNLTNVKVKLTKDDVSKLILNKYKDSKISNIHLEDEDGNVVYGVNLIITGSEHDIKIDANSGNILKDEVDNQNSEKSSEETDKNKEENDLSYKSSVQITDNKDIAENKTKDLENKEEASLKGLAKITADQVKTIISNKYKEGIVTKVALENENGNVVYGVKVNAKDGVHDIKVDAGNGNILIDQIGE